MTEKSSDPAPGRDQLREEASLWFARMRGEDAAAHRPAFEAWLARGAVHRAAYNRVAEIFSAGKILKQQRPAQPLPRWLSAPILAAAVVLLLIGTGFGSYRYWRSNDGSTEATPIHSMAAAMGEIRTVNLIAGVQMILDSDALAQRTGPGAVDQLRLVRGRARLQVMDAALPLGLAAADTRILSKAGEFDVSVDGSQRVLVSAWRGSVEIVPSEPRVTSASSFRVILMPGERAVMDGRGRLRVMKSDDGLRNWPEGWREYDNAPLAAVVADANRYAKVKLRIDDARVAVLRVSGRFRITETEQLARHLASVFDLRLDRTRKGSVTLSLPPRE